MDDIVARLPDCAKDPTITIYRPPTASDIAEEVEVLMPALGVFDSYIEDDSLELTDCPPCQAELPKPEPVGCGNNPHQSGDVDFRGCGPEGYAQGKEKGRLGDGEARRRTGGGGPGQPGGHGAMGRRGPPPAQPYPRCSCGRSNTLTAGKG